MTTTTETNKPSPMHAAYISRFSASQDIHAADRVPGGVPDEEMNRLIDASRDAAWALVRASVERKGDLAVLATAVQEIFAEVDLVGTPSDQVHRAMLDKLIREVMRACV
jgi:uncharacterized protein Yka (UPF0111/DUF47 family)